MLAHHPPVVGPKRAIIVGVAFSHHIRQRCLIFLQRHLGIAVLVEELELAHHHLVAALEPELLELIKRQRAILVGIEFSKPLLAVLVDLRLGKLAVLVGVITLHHLLAHHAVATAHSAMATAAHSAHATHHALAISHIGTGKPRETAQRQQAHRRGGSDHLCLSLHHRCSFCDSMQIRRLAASSSVAWPP